MMDIHKILKQLPHRYPFLLVDRVLELEKGVRIKALKNVTINEPFFTGHFPHRPVMPGVLMLEALAQVGFGISETLPHVTAAPHHGDEFTQQQQRQHDPGTPAPIHLAKGLRQRSPPLAVPKHQLTDAQ